VSVFCLAAMVCQEAANVIHSECERRRRRDIPADPPRVCVGKGGGGRLPFKIPPTTSVSMLCRHKELLSYHLQVPYVII
jgi:hypothetical protein